MTTVPELARPIPLIETQSTSDDLLIVMLRSAELVYAAKLSLPEFELLSTTELAAVGRAM